MFEDIGHSSEARTKMKEYLIGTLQVAHLNHAFSRSCCHIKKCCFSLQIDPNAPKNSKAKKVSAVADKKGGLNPIAVALLLIAIAVGVYFSQMK
jgi:hypothetical protein